MALFIRLLAVTLTGWFCWVFVSGGGVLQVGVGEIPVAAFGIFFPFIFMAFVPVGSMLGSRMTLNLEMSLMGSVSLIFVLCTLSAYGVAAQRQKNAETRKQAEIAAMPKWRGTKGTTVSETIRAWQAASDFRHVEIAFGDLDYPIDIDFEIAAPDLCGALQGLSKGFGGAKQGIRVACRKRERVALIASKEVEHTRPSSIDIEDDRCAVLNPRWGTISMRKGACATVAASGS